MIIREARPADAQGIATVHVDSWNTTYKGIVPDEVLARRTYASLEQRWTGFLATAEQDQHFIYVATDESGAIIGFADGGAHREKDLDYTGELYAIYLLQQRQGQGVGRLLTAAIARRLLQAGLTSMLVWVLADNPSRPFYERLGGKLVKTQELDMGRAKLTEVAYGWSDITPLAGAESPGR